MSKYAKSTAYHYQLGRYNTRLTIATKKTKQKKRVAAEILIL